MTNLVDIRPDHLRIVQDGLRDHLPVGVKVWVFGSRAQWSAREGSDLDLALEGEVEIDRKVMGALVDAFEDSDLPYTVDVVDINRISKRFRHIVESSRVPLPVTGEWRAGHWGEFVTLEYGRALRGYRDSIGPFRVFGTNGPIGWHNEPLCSHPSVIIGRKGAYRGVHYSDEPFFAIDTAFYLKPKTDIDMRWAYYQLLTQDINGMDSGSAIPSTSREEFYRLPLTLPPPSEQRAIARVLGALDDKIELNRRMNGTLEEMARALFRSWFVDFDPVRAKIDGRWRRGESLPGLPSDLYNLLPERMVPSELGEIPEGWEVKTVGDLATVVGGSTPSTKTVEYWEGGTHCWATPKDLATLSVPVLLDTERKITDTGLKRIASGLQPPGTVLLSSRAPVGYLAINEIPVAINQGFIAIQPKRGVPNLFLLYWCDSFLAEILNHANGSTFLEVSKSSFRGIPIVEPSEPVLACYRELASILYQKLVANERSTRALSDQRDALLPKLVSGQVKVDPS